VFGQGLEAVKVVDSADREGGDADTVCEQSPHAPYPPDGLEGHANLPNRGHQRLPTHGHFTALRQGLIRGQRSLQRPAETPGSANLGRPTTTS
jgi:hypothetical protein